MNGPAPAIASYGLLGDCHSAALVSAEGSIDWWCMPRFDSGTCFGRLLDAERGGFCRVSLAGEAHWRGSSYREQTLVLDSVVDGPQGTAKVTDFVAMREQGACDPRRELIRVVECVRGSAEVTFEVAPRFDYGSIGPWIRRASRDTFTAIGGNDGLVIWSDGELEGHSDRLLASAVITAGERLRLMLRYVPPHLLDHESTSPSAAEIDARLEETVDWWQRWYRRVNGDGAARDEGVARSALTLKALSYAPTGAFVAAATTSLPEVIGGERNWDYRYSWVRDSALSSRAMAELGCEREAAAFRHFIIRSAAGHVDDLQILFGVGGERRTIQEELDLDGFRDSRPVRIGNDARGQVQLDTYGEILNLAWRWHRRGHSPDDDEWRFFAELADAAAERWQQPDRGIWEWRGEPRHFVHSKACCWAAVDRGLRLAEECSRRAPSRRWQNAREEIRAAIESHGYDEQRGVFVQCFGETGLDAALLLLPVVGFVEFDDERMLRTVDAVHEELNANGFLYRYREDDDLPGREGAFVACSFWLAECYAQQGRLPQAREVFDRAMGAANPLGLFSEEVDPETGSLLGNYPQTLTHLSHITAAAAFTRAEARVNP